MANKTLFSSIKSLLPRADSYNEAGGRAYKFTPKHALAQMAATGCFNGVYYASAQSQLDEMRKLIDRVDDNVFLAKLAVYARERAYMKDMPAALLVMLSKRDTELMHRVFDRVVDNGRVMRTMFQMIRSGQFDRTSLSSSLQRAFQRWLNEASVGKLLSSSIGNDPSLRDVLRNVWVDGSARREHAGKKSATAGTTRSPVCLPARDQKRQYHWSQIR